MAPRPNKTTGTPCPLKVSETVSGTAGQNGLCWAFARPRWIRWTVVQGPPVPQVLGHHHDVFQVEAVFWFGALLWRDAAGCGPLGQIRYAPLKGASEGRKAMTHAGVVPAAMKSMISSYDLLWSICRLLQHT